MPRNSSCQGCGLAKFTPAGHRCVWGTGASDARIMLVGEALGENEAEQQKPFVGPAGGLLNDALQRAGLRREDVYISNVVKDRPPDNRTPTSDEVKACIGYLIEEINTVHPDVIVALGGTALKALAGKDSVTKERGRILEAKVGLRISAKLLATWHPAYYLHTRNQQVLDQLAADLALARRTAYGNTIKSERYAILPPPIVTAKEIDDALRKLADCRAVSCDLEWTGAEGERIKWPWTPGAMPYSVAFTGRVNGRLISVGIGHISRRPHPCIQSFFDDHPIVAHNAQSDLIWLLAMGYHVRLGGDTMLLANLLDETQGLSLEQLSSTYTDAEAGWKFPPWPQPPATEAEWLKLLGHNMGDTEATLLLHDALLADVRSRSEIERTNILRLYKNLVLPAVLMFVEMAHVGVGIDLELIAKIIAEVQNEETKLSAEYGTLLGVDAQAANAIAMSPDKTVKTLRQRFGLPVTSSNENDLLEYAKERPVELTQGIRHEHKTNNTYLRKWEKLASRSDGRLHTVYRQTGARTGRSSAEIEKGGSVQVAPREKRVRQVVVAAEGNVIVSADESQVELRISAWFAGEKRMLEAYQNPKSDLHCTTAAFNLAMQQDHLDPLTFWDRRAIYEAMVDPKTRQGGKSENFGLVYGMGWQRWQMYVRREFGLWFSDEEAQLYYSNYHVLYPDIKPWHQRCIHDFERLGYTVTPFGRYRRHIEDPHKSINTPVQAFANDLTMLGGIAIRETFARKRMPWKLTMYGHDAITTECPPSEKDEVKAIMKHCLEHPPIERLGLSEIGVPLLADVKASERWSS